MKIDPRMQNIRLILSDVDGVMTDGGITYDNQGIETKTFHVRDGMGIKLWQKSGHQFGIITARSSHIVKLRMDELKVNFIRQGIEEKLSAAQQIIDELGFDLTNVCYIGDDLTDAPLLNAVGFSVTVADGAADLRSNVHHVTKLPGGQGALRELIETILKSQNRWSELLQSWSL